MNIHSKKVNIKSINLKKLCQLRKNEHVQSIGIVIISAENIDIPITLTTNSIDYSSAGVGSGCAILLSLNSLRLSTILS